MPGYTSHEKEFSIHDTYRPRTKFGAFSDESSHTEGRYRSIAAISLPVNTFMAVSNRLSEAIARAPLTEFKWGELRGVKRVRCAEAFIDITIDAVLTHDMRVDVLTWDTHDYRHQVPNRDDRLNYERMFFFLHRHAVRCHGQHGEWHLRPDQLIHVDWDRVRRCLDSSGTWAHKKPDPLFEEAIQTVRPAIKSLVEQNSKQPLFASSRIYSPAWQLTRGTRPRLYAAC